MRNLVEYPITKDEIVHYLDFLIRELGYTNTELVGDMGPLLLQAAKEYVEKGG